jgi:hypothetical protein
MQRTYVFIQGRLNVMAHPAAAGAQASTSFKIGIYKNQIFNSFLPFYKKKTIRNSIVGD